MTTLLNGLLGGLLVGVVAALVARLVGDAPAAMSRLVGTARGGDAPRSPWVGLLLSVLYGSVAGGVLVALELYVLGVLAVPPTAAEAFGVALAWSAVLFVAVAAVGRAAADLAEERSYLLELFVFHLVYGVGLGLWIRMTWIT